MDEKDIYEIVVKNQIKKVFVGRNGVGKTYILDNIYKYYEDKENELLTDKKYVFYLKSEADQNKGNRKQLLNKILNLLYFNEENKKYKIMVEKTENIIGQIRKDAEFVEKEINKDITIPISLKYRFNYNHLNDYAEVLEFRNEDKYGDGYEYYSYLSLIIFLLKKLSRKKNFKNKLILLIDEPERYSHPTLIDKLAMELSSCVNSFNIICSSHSPIFVKNFISNMGDIIYLNKKGEYINYSDASITKNIRKVYAKDLESKYYDSKQQFFKADSKEDLLMSAMRSNIIEVIYSNVVALVEGYADVTMINRSIKLSKNNVNTGIINVDGKGMFPAYISFLKNYNLPIFVLFDKDASRTDETNSLYNDYIKQNSTNYLYFEKCLEEDLGLDNSRDKKKYSTPLEIIIKSGKKNKVSKKIAEIDDTIYLVYLEYIQDKDIAMEEISKLQSKIKNKLSEVNDVQNVSFESKEYLFSHYKALKKLSNIYLIANSDNLFTKEQKHLLSYMLIKDDFKIESLSFDNYKEIISKIKENKIGISNEPNEISYLLHRIEKRKYSIPKFAEYYTINKDLYNHIISYIEAKKLDSNIKYNDFTSGVIEGKLQDEKTILSEIPNKDSLLMELQDKYLDDKIIDRNKLKELAPVSDMNFIERKKYYDKLESEVIEILNKVGRKK
jgi:predicted ATP-dependent endonuclease of OLD family